MFTNNKLAKSVRLAIAFGAAATALPASQAFAQEESAEDIEKIAVTGSRIKTASLTSSSPLQILNAADIDASGIANIQDLLLDNPTFGTPAISRTNSNFSTASAGVATVDLRNLGTARTLVLVNGRRFVSGVPGSSAVDLNSIPAQFIERVEILTGGASSVYGSDAVAGVVNLILKKEFDGIEFEGQYGESAKGDDRENQYSLTGGISDDKGHMMFHLGYTKQGAVFSKDREKSAVDQFGSIYFTGELDDIFNAERPFYSSYPPQGRFDAGDTRYTYNSSNQLQAGFSTNGNGTIGPDGFNRSAYRTIAIPTERYLFASKGQYELSDDHSVFFEGTYAASQTKTQLEPFPFASDDIYAGGAVPLEFNVDGVVYANPTVPADILNSANANADGLKQLDFFAKRLLDVGNRGNIADRDTFRFTTGLEGVVLEDWYYDLYYVYGQTKEGQVSSGQVNVQNFRYALEAMPDVNDLDGDGNTTEAVCIDATARSFGCVPIDIYGFNSITEEAAAYVNAPGLLSTFVSQEIVGGNISGEIMELPAGYVGIAAGFEHRTEYARSEFDALQQAGLNAGNAIPRTEGQFDLTEFYVETNVPIIDGMYLKGAVRGSDYSTVGSTLSYNYGIDWEVTDWLKLRAIQAQSTRAPNINELFSPPSQTFPSGLNDPCEGVTASTGGTLGERCLADAGIAANVAANGSHTLSQADLQGISGFNRGNPNVEEEKGKSTTVGIVLSPELPGLDSFGFTIDYFDIEIEDAIVSTPRQFILDQCYTGDQSFCSFITRRASQVGTNSAGSIEFIDSGVSNSGGVVAEGVDLTTTFSLDVGDGSISGRFAYTYMLEGYSIPLPGSDADPFVGEIGAPEHKANFNLTYTVSDLSVTLGGTYIGESYVDDQFLAGFGFEPETASLDAITYLDTQVSYKLTDIVEVYGGVNNLLDEDAPLIPGGVTGSDTGLETDGGTYDPIGQSFYAGFRAKF
ncbi:MAG: TonB-dependent receptor [Gammaproteobacteria bacterium]|nr:TonB-dependent receptor [Gammaproteobacteria bacterium]